MSVLNRLKAAVEGLPPSVGLPLSYVPFWMRLGPVYLSSQRWISRSETGELEVLDRARFEALVRMVKLAYDEVEFYREHYRANGFSPGDLRTWTDWDNVPVVTKTDLQAFPLNRRVARGGRGMKINTGGTSGQPLEFFLDKQAFAREWAHMHRLWFSRGYRPHHLKLTFRGKHFDRSEVLRYNAVHNELIVNANAEMHVVVEAVQRLPNSTVIRWLHGYPSLVSEFAHAFSEYGGTALERFRSRLFGVLLGSEFPAPVYRKAIEDALSSNVLSWYGHSEMAVLAGETARGVYRSLPSYGYAEAVKHENGGEDRLVCTSLHNRVHPFIRYDTGDVVEAISQDSGGLSFRVTEGRVGDFVVDRNGQRHSLTAIVFGRHHSGFGLVKHLQVKEVAPGRVTVMITPQRIDVDLDAMRKGFDLDDLAIDWSFELVDAPVRTPAGKIKLKIS